MKKKQIYKKAIDKWGFESQSIMLMEECAELIQAVSKLHRTGNPEKMYEEIADVKIMIEQMILYLGESSAIKINEYDKEKLKRLEKRVNNEEKADI